VDGPPVDDLVERIEHIIEWSRGLNSRERETLREAVAELRRSRRTELATATG
jgi:hypothetical protein